jgi:hypothetical protein
VPPRVGTAIYSVYGDQPGDIYFIDGPTRSVFQWPDFETSAYWNGYRWTHRTDALGFRDPPELADRSLVLLGDSMIYGHGVEETDTVAHFLRAEHGRPAYSAARQGDCLYQEYLVARLLLPKLHPRTLVVTTFLNDFEDLEIYRTPEEIAAAAELSLDADALAARVAHPKRKLRLAKQLHRSKVWRLVEAAWQQLHAPDGGGAVAAAPPDAVPSFVRAITDDDRYAPIAHYYEVVLGDLAQRARASGTALVLLDLDVGDHVVAGSLPAQDRLWALLQSIADANGVRALNTRAVFAGCEECFLPLDGHLSGIGHRRLAAFLDDALPR